MRNASGMIRILNTANSGMVSDILDISVGKGKGKPMKLINPERLIEDKGFYVKDENECFLCVVAAQDIRNAPGVTLVPAVPGHTDQHNISEMAYNNGYAKGYEDGKRDSEKRGHWIIHSSGHGAMATNYAECSECHVCGSPQWKVCPVCEARMVENSGE